MHAPERPRRAYIEEAGAGTHDEACLIEPSDAGGAVRGLAIGQVGAGVSEVHPRGEIGVIRGELKRGYLYRY